MNEEVDGYRPVVLFPGVEISVGNIHLLAIFSEKTRRDTIIGFLGKIDIPIEKFGDSQKVTTKSLSNVVQIIKETEGIAVPAHILSVKGLLADKSGIDLKQTLGEIKELIFAAEIAEKQADFPQLFKEEKINWTRVLGSDSHHIAKSDDNKCEMQKFPGSHYTWVKMSKPTFEGLKLALTDGKLSVICSDESPNNPNFEHGAMVIESVKIKKAKYIGVHSEFICEFNPWFNSLVGSRGSSKSTILEFIRLNLSQREFLPLNIQHENKMYFGEDDKGHNLFLPGETSIEVYYRTNGRRYRVVREAGTLMQVENGYWDGKNFLWRKIPNNDDETIRQYCPVCIYSQKEIFELARDPQALLKTIDSHPRVGYYDWKKRAEKHKNEYLALTAEMQNLIAALKEKATLNSELEMIIKEIEYHENKGTVNILKNYKESQYKKNLIEVWEQSWENLDTLIQTNSDQIKPVELSQEKFDSEQEENKEFFYEVEKVEEFFSGIRKDLDQIAVSINEFKKEWQKNKGLLQINKLICQIEVERNSLIKEQAESSDAFDATFYTSLLNSKRELEDELIPLMTVEEDFVKNQIEIKAKKEEILNHRVELTKNRRIFLEEALASSEELKIEVEPFGAIELYEDIEREFRNNFALGDRTYARHISSDNNGILAVLYKEPKNRLTGIEALKKKVRELVYGDVETTDSRLNSLFRGTKYSVVEEFETWFPEDYLNVSCRFSNGWRSIESGSPGQKTAALLSFILATGVEPLILDQPEDDLDNKYISEIIVNLIRKVKTKRQIIIATHNANIVVNGDAENIIILEPKGVETKIKEQDGLQEPKIRKEVCSIMEGGEAAFKKRYKRVVLDC